MYPSLNKSYKNLFPFSIGTTSFIYPDDYVPNVKLLGPYLDSIELLFFESQPADALPSKKMISELAGLAREFSLGYNVHLPMDITISSKDPQQTENAIQTIITVAERVAPLGPTTLTLHVPYQEASLDEATIKPWQQRVINNIGRVLASGIPAQLISIENLDYPFEVMAPIISELDLSVCFDFGHLMLMGADIQHFYDTYRDQIEIIHLYHAQQNHVHVAIDGLAEKSMHSITECLSNFSGTVSLEVFSFVHLEASLRCLEKYWTFGNNH